MKTPEPLDADARLLTQILGETLREHDGEPALLCVQGLREAAIDLRAGRLQGGRAAFGARIAGLALPELALVARSFTQYFHLINVAEEQQRIRVLRERDRVGAPPEGSIAAACAELHAQGATAGELRTLLDRLFVMPVLTAHPTEARRRTVLDHLDDVAWALDRLDDPRLGARDRDHTTSRLREAVAALFFTEEARATRPSPLDEIRASMQIFERTLFLATPMIYRELEDALATFYPGADLPVPAFLRWGTWIGGDRDGNPNVTAEVTRAAFERQRAVALMGYIRDTNTLIRELSISARRVPTGAASSPELEASLAADRVRMAEVESRARTYASTEPWREKLWYMRARLEAARGRTLAGYPDAQSYLDDLRLLERSLMEAGLTELARGRLRDARRRAEVFGFHLASLDLREHSAVHEAAVAELLTRGGLPDYRTLPEDKRAQLLGQLLERADIGRPPDRAGLSPATRELLATLEVVGRARRDLGPAACERYVVSFTSALSDLLEVLFLARAARLSPDELRPVPLLEQLEDLEQAAPLASQILQTPALRVALGNELEVMVGYSDSGKQVGYVASQVALHRAQEALANVAEQAGIVLTVFHGRGGAIGRGGGPANRAIRAQPPQALRGRLRVTEQGETVTARYGRLEIARRDLEQMVHAVLLASLPRTGDAPDAAEQRARSETLDRAASAAHRAYADLLSDQDRLAAYAIAATPIEEVAELPIASRPAARRAGLSFDDLRAIPWVFSWNQSRHGIPGWFGLGSALEALLGSEGLPRVRQLYERWPFFHALIDNAQLALVRSDIEVAREYAQLADPDARTLFGPIALEHARTRARILELTGRDELLAAWPAIAATVQRRNPHLDVLSHAQIELLRRLRATPLVAAGERERIREILFVTIKGIAAGLQTAG